MWYWLFLTMSVVYVDDASSGKSEGNSDEYTAVRNSIANFEKHFLGREILIDSGFQTHRVESNADGLVIRLNKVQPVKKRGYIVHSGSYASLKLGQAITLNRYDPPKPNVAPPVPFFSYIATKSELAEKFDSALYGICYGQRFSDYLETGTSSKTELANGKILLTSFHGDTGTWVQFAMKSNGLLESVRWEIQPGMTLPDGRVCPSNQWYKQQAIYEYNAENPAKVNKITTIDQGPDGKTAKAIHDFFDKGELKEALPILIDLPGYNLKNGTRVDLLGQTQKHFQFQDGRVVAVVDSESVRAAQSARWRQSALRSPYYYLGLSFCLCTVVFILVWRRKRK